MNCRKYKLLLKAKDPGDSVAIIKHFEPCILETYNDSAANNDSNDDKDVKIGNLIESTPGNGPLRRQCTIKHSFSVRNHSNLPNLEQYKDHNDHKDNKRS